LSILRVFISIIFIRGFTKMDMTAAHRQAAFRRRMKAGGYRLMQVWVDARGFPGKVQDRDGAKGREVTLGQLEDVLAGVVAGTDGDFAPRLYGELAAFAKGVREIWDLSRINQDLFKQETEELQSFVPGLLFK
jgi:hypothetical protein